MAKHIPTAEEEAAYAELAAAAARLREAQRQAAEKRQGRITEPPRVDPHINADAWDFIAGNGPHMGLWASFVSWMEEKGHTEDEIDLAYEAACKAAGRSA